MLLAIQDTHQGSGVSIVEEDHQTADEYPRAGQVDLDPCEERPDTRTWEPTVDRFAIEAGIGVMHRSVPGSLGRLAVL